MREPAIPAAEEITLRAHAKLNVFLRVLGRRADGFHDLESLMLPLELHDLLTVRRADHLRLDVKGPQSARIPTDQGNLVLVAGRALLDAANLREAGADIELDKRVPVAAGLGGGSADAAAALHALNALGGCGLGATELHALGAVVGSDVPALLANQPVFVTGRGEHVTPVHVPITWWVVKPFGFEVRTQEAFGWWDADPATGPDTGVLIAAAETGNDELLGSALFNDLQAPVTARHPEISDAIEAFLEAGALGAVMTGSGPTVVALASNLSHADRLAEAVGGSTVTSGPPAPSHPASIAG
jgi:4-diphosphocytidyl-2-C-methyl-D-erythritol kinase